MSGSKRKSGYRKNVTKAYDDEIPSLREGIDIVAKIIANRGSNLFDVEVSGLICESEDNNERNCHIAVLPNKFKNLIWIKRNDYVIIELSGNGSNNDINNKQHDLSIPSDNIKSQERMQYDIKNILNKDHIKQLKALGQWPIQFDAITAINNISNNDVPLNEPSASNNSQKNGENIVDTNTVDDYNIGGGGGNPNHNHSNNRNNNTNHNHSLRNNQPQHNMKQSSLSSGEYYDMSGMPSNYTPDDDDGGDDYDDHSNRNENIDRNQEV